jgi:long-chain acyl-CoA synthetase
MAERVRETLHDYFRSIAALEGEYLVYDDGYRPRSYSYADCARAARNLAARLGQAGITRGDKIILWSENRPEWVAAFWGCVLAGVIVAPIDQHHSAAFLERVAGVIQPKAILAGDEVELPIGERGPAVWHIAELDWKSEAHPAQIPVTPDDQVEILFTSGATAEPKGVLITHRNILSNIVPVEKEALKYRKYATPFFPIRFLNLLPLSHMFGQAMAMFIPPMVDGTVVFQRSQTPHEILRQIKSRRISVLVSVPKILEVLRDYIIGLIPEAATPAPANEKFWWRWWRYRKVHKLCGLKFWSFVVGGAALDPKLESFFGGLGFAVIQGYGLTEAAPIVTLNHPFHSRKGTVGKPIAGVEIRIADDGEVMVRGGNVTSGYYNDQAATREAFADGWFHTGDIGELDESGRLLIKGRKKEMIVLPDGRNVFPEDIERVLSEAPGVREAAAVGVLAESGEQVHAVLVLEPGANPAEIIREVNPRLEEHQKIRGFTVWENGELPRTEGTRKLKRREIGARVRGEAPSLVAEAPAEGVEDLLARFAGGRQIDQNTTLDELGLSSLDRVELLVALEQKLGGATIDEGVFGRARTVADLDAIRRDPLASAAPVDDFEFPAWSRSRWARLVRVVNLNLWILPLAHLFAWVRVKGKDHLRELEGPVLFASNHQSYFDTPVLFIAMPWRWRRRLTPAMRKEFFDAHFHPAGYSRWKGFTNSLNYYLSALVFNGVPIPQREAGARRTLHYLGEMAAEGWCPLIFPEGRHSEDETITRFQPGVGMMASRLKLPVVPIRIRGANQVLHPAWKFARPGIVTVTFGEPIRLAGDDYAALAKQVEDAVRAL